MLNRSAMTTSVAVFFADALCLTRYFALSPLAKTFPSRYTPLTHKSNEYIRRLIMLYCEIFLFSRAYGDRTCSSVIDIVLR